MAVHCVSQSCVHRSHHAFRCPVTRSVSRTQLLRPSIFCCRHGFGKWQAIISDPDPNVGPMLAARTNVDLKVCLQHTALIHRPYIIMCC